MSQLPVDWDDDVVRQYLTPESHQKSKEEFEKTHIDIDRIKAEYLFPHPTNDEFVTQEEFRDAILKSNVQDDNRIFILRGETGSGKSQLCQWLEYQVGRSAAEGYDETHIGLHVSRSQTRIQDIVDILTEPVDVDIEVGSVANLDPEKVADAMISNLEAFAPTLSQTISEDEILSLTENQSGVDLREILKENISEYQQAVSNDEDVGQIPDLIDDDDYRDLAMAAFGEARGRDTIYPTLVSFLHDELSGKLNVGNFQDKLEQISDAYVEKGLRPVLICEDLTTFSVLKEQLLDHIFQLDSGHYDVVLGWTTGWEKDDLDKALGTSENTYTYMKDRAEGYLSTTDDTGQAYFLTEDVTVELARKYVSVIRDESDATLDVDVPEDDFDNLYPFNAEFVKTAYEHLIQDGNERRTPRLLLIRIIRECLTSTQPPFESIDGNPYVKQFPSPVAIELPPAVQNLAKWYGITTAEGNIRLPESIFKTFDVAIPEDPVKQDDQVIFQVGGGPIPDFELEQVAGSIEPGATITVKTTIDGRPEPDSEIDLDGEVVGFTDDDGLCDVTLPNEDGAVTVTAEKAENTAERTFELGTDSLTLVASPSNPDQGDEVTITARFNGEPVEGARLNKDEEQVGETDSEGKITIAADESPEIELSGQVNGVEDSLTLTVAGDSTTYPVPIDLPPEEVDQRRFEYEQWIKTGESYDSSDTLRRGAATVLEMWHEPTRLANSNASTRGVAGIYYARGSETPVSIQAVDERQGLSIELPFGTEYNQVYEPLLWCGLSENDTLPQEDQYDLNYDLLRGWVDDQVADFREEMRTTIEECLPEDWTIEEFIIVAQYMLHNAANGTTELSRELVFEPYSTEDLRYDHPIRARFGRNDSFHEAYSELTKSSSVPSNLAEGFFKLKSDFVDDERLAEAYEAVVGDIDAYLQEAMYIEPDLGDAFRIGTTRSSATVRFEPVLERVQEYAQELNSLGPDDVQHIRDKIETVDQWFDDSHNVPKVAELYGSLYDAVGKLDVNIIDDWERKKEILENQDNDRLNMAAFKRDMRTFREIETADAPEIVSLLHKFEQSLNQQIEWEIYENISDMIEKANAVEFDDSQGGLEEAVRESQEMTALMNERAAVEESIGGDY